VNLLVVKLLLYYTCVFICSEPMHVTVQPLSAVGVNKIS